MKLTQRDKKLLIFLAIVVILAGFGRLLIYPLAEKISAQTEQIDDLELKQTQLEMKINQKLILQKGLEEIKVKTNDGFARYYDILQSQEVDKEITNIALDHGLSAVYLNVIMPKKSLETHFYTYSEFSKSDDEDKQLDRFFTPAIQMQLTGDMSKMWEFVDDIIYNHKNIRIVSYEFENAIETGNNTMTISMYMYTCDKGIK